MATRIHVLAQGATAGNRLPDFRTWVTQHKHGVVALDIETTGLVLGHDQILMVQLAADDQDVWILDWRATTSVQRVGLLQPLAELFADALLVGHNINFDLSFLFWPLPGTDYQPLQAARVHDTMLAEQVWIGRGGGEAGFTGYSLAATLERHGLGVMSKAERSWFIGLNAPERRAEYIAPFPQAQLEYGARDVVSLLPLRAKQVERFEDDAGLARAFALEMAALPAIVRMEAHGVHVNRRGWMEVIRDQEAEAARLSEQLMQVFGTAMLREREREFARLNAKWLPWRRDYEQAKAAKKQAIGTGWRDYQPVWDEVYRMEHEPEPPAPEHGKLASVPNPRSPAQLQTVLHSMGVHLEHTREQEIDRLLTDLHEGQRAGKWSLGRTLSDEQVATVTALLETMVAYRGAAKFGQSFGATLLALGTQVRNGDIFCLHPTVNLIGAATGRMSSEKPNWQQVPRLGEGDKLRANVVPVDDDHWLLTADFSNIEMRVLAALSGCEALNAVFAAGGDLHSETAKKMFNLPAEWGKHECAENIWKFGKSYRDAGKILNFRTVYGGTVYGLARMLRVSVDEANDLQQAYLTTFPGVARYLQARRDEVHKTLESRTESGRRRVYQRPLEGEAREHVYPHSQWISEHVHDWRVQQGRDDEALYHSDVKRMVERDWEAIERKAMNTPIQGTSADITKRALVLLHARLGALRPEEASLVAVVHDEFVVEVRGLEFAREVGRWLAEAMTQAAAEYRVTLPPFTVEPARRWAKD